MIRRILEEGTDAPAPMRGFLGEALRAGWVEFWYQPTIDLRSRRTVGVEALCRVRHPQMGLLTPDRFLPSADPSERTRLVELSIVTALYDIKLFSGFGLDFRVAVNMPIEALHSLSIPALLRVCGSRERTDTHLTFEIPEAQLEGDLSALQENGPTQLSTYGISLARNGVNPTATALHLDGGKLKRRMVAANSVSGKAMPPTFVELMAPALSTNTSARSSWKAARASYESIGRVPRSADVAALSRALWDVAS